MVMPLFTSLEQDQVEYRVEVEDEVGDEVVAGVVWKTGQRDGQQDRQCTELPRLRLRKRMMLRMRMKLGQVEDWAERGPADRQCCELLPSFELPSTEH